MLPFVYKKEICIENTIEIRERT